MWQTRIDDTLVTISPRLIATYNQAGPRYTSYPTAPQWQDTIDHRGYQQILADSNHEARPLSLYVHLPFCEEHCTFCGCNVVITKQKAVTVPYLAALHQELTLLARHLDPSRALVQVHWGGGTPTYLTCGQIEMLWGDITQQFRLAPGAEIGIEVDPRVTTPQQLRTLRHCGFNRLSMGIQDFDPQVQAAVRRIQPYDMTAELLGTARTLGFGSINVDLIYGLPLQTPAGFAATVEQTVALQPDRVACFNFAYVPWLKAQQRRIDPATLPAPDTKMQVWCRTIQQFAEAGYVMIGFDHFARADDELAHAMRQGSLWRNFQGYSTQAGTDLIACGITGISDIDGHYVQNGKKLSQYQRTLGLGQLPVEKGCHLTPDDQIRRHVIRELLCNQRVDFSELAAQFTIDPADYFAADFSRLAPLIDDGLAHWTGDVLQITPLGRLFARNIAMAFDAYVARETQCERRYSRTV